MQIALGSTAKGIAFGTTFTLSKGIWIVTAWVAFDYAPSDGIRPVLNKLINKTNSSIIGQSTRGTPYYGGGVNNTAIVQCLNDTVVELQTYDYGNLAGHNVNGNMQAYKLSNIA